MSLLPPVPSAIKVYFAQHFRGRGHKKREQVTSNYDTMSWRNQTRITGHHGGPKRMPDIDDPRPPIVGWKCSPWQVDHDGTLPLTPYEAPTSDGRRIMQGLYCDFREIYNQHYTVYPIYGGGPWEPEISWNAWIHPSATVIGQVRLAGPVFIHADAVVRGDLNRVEICSYVHIMEGCVLTTDGHPRNTNKPGRVSKINEGVCYVGQYSYIHPNCMIDSAYIGVHCEVGEGCKLGNGAVMERFSSLEPGTVLLANQRVPRFEIWGGNPARKMGYREKDLNRWIGRMEMMVNNVGMNHSCETIWPHQAHNVTATRSSERLQENFDVKLNHHVGKVPSKVREYIDRFTPEIPLWEMYKNMSRMNLRPGMKREWSWNFDPKKSRWIDHY